MRIAILTVKVPFVWGGAEVQAQELQSELIGQGHCVELVAIPFKWYPPERILDHMLACRLLDLSDSEGIPIDLAIGLKFPAYLAQHDNKVLWIIHQYRQAYEMWGHPEFGDLELYSNGISVRNAIRQADSTLLPKAKAIFAESLTVAARLKTFNQVVAEPLYHPPSGAERFYRGAPGDFLFYPSRLIGPKRQELVLEALAQTRRPVRVKFAGVPNHRDYLQVLQRKAAALGVSDRVEWLGSISEDEKRDLYATCLAVPYPPYCEDYGYVTLEAMLSSKAVITCSDSGGPLEFIEDGVNGLVVPPDAASLAEAFDSIWGNRAQAERMGAKSLDKYRALGISWGNVIEKLLG